MSSEKTSKVVVGGDEKVQADMVESNTLAHHWTTKHQAGVEDKQLQYVYNPMDGSVLQDHHNRPLTVDRLLATKPLRHELSTRPGPGNKKLTYISGDGVSRTLNDIFGFDGWNLDISSVKREDMTKDEKGRYHVVYTAQVRLTHKASGAYKEDCGAGDSMDKVLGTAIGHALKASITDAMKRSARHFGDKLGNCK
jgi:DNA recombination protein Rad52